MSETAGADLHCNQCQRLIHADEPRHAIDAGALCANCYGQLRQEVERQLDDIESGINYPVAFVVHSLGAGVGAVLYVASILLSGWDVAIVAIGMPWIGTWAHQKAIGFKRSTALAVMAVTISLGLFAAIRLLLMDASASTFDFIDIFWVGLIGYEAWRRNKPLR